ncbi:MAG: uracil-DNA glycosylase family protein [Muribaculaceae bacterium]|nr:uracil-DNA glycosylase family protein [Muribaculaceae bacterium]
MEIESHPWPPFIPEGAKVLIMGTFPPQAKRWNMDFYYPNRTNDFWKICGLLFLGDKDALLIPGTKDYDIDKIRALMTEKHIALNDTVRKARRLKGNASDKFLEVVEPVPLYDLLREMPDCHAVATTGEKAGTILAEITGTEIPKIGEYVEATLPEELNLSSDKLEIWRMPSTSRAYPLAVEKKAESYAKLFRHLRIL